MISGRSNVLHGRNRPVVVVGLNANTQGPVLGLTFHSYSCVRSNHISLTAVSNGKSCPSTQIVEPVECKDKTPMDTEKLQTLLVVTILCCETLSFASLQRNKLGPLVTIMEQIEPYRPGISVSRIFHPFIEPNSCGHSTASVKSPFAD